MRKTLAEIASLIKGEVVGDKNFVVTGVSGIREAKEGDLTFIADPKYISSAKETKASVIIISREMDVPGKFVIRTDNPSLAFTQVLTLISEDENFCRKGIHKTAVIAPDAVLGKNVAIGPHVVIESQAKIGNNTVIYSGTFVGNKTIIGRDCLIYPNVTLRECIMIGNDVIVHSGTVIGSDGFGFIKINGVHKKIPQVGTVIIEDDVEIGSNVTIDRARFNKTIIGQGTKIDNLVQIAHNVVIGKNCIIISQVGISGTVTIEDEVVLAGQAGVGGHLTISKGAIVTAQAAVMKSIPPSEKVSGSPARPYMEAKRALATMQKLPQYVKKIKELEKRVEAFEAKTKNN